MNNTFLLLKPIPMKEGVFMIFVWYGRIDMRDGAFVVIDKNGVHKHIPVGPLVLPTLVGISLHKG